MPVGSVNFLLACLILALKALLLFRIQMPAFFCYMTASIVTTSCYILGWESMEAAWLPTVAVLGVVAAIECTRWALGLQSEHEQTAVTKWCVLLGLVLTAAAMVNSPIVYPKYSTAVYEIRLYSMMFSVGYLTALLGYCFAVSGGVSRYVWHGSILLLRLAAMGALLLVHDRALWFAADLTGSVVNVLTLGMWLWLFSPRFPVKSAVQRLNY